MEMGGETQELGFDLEVGAPRLAQTDLEPYAPVDDLEIDDAADEALRDFMARRKQAMPDEIG